MTRVNIEACRKYLSAADHDTQLEELAAWVTLIDLAGGGERDVAMDVDALVRWADSDSKLALLAAGPVRELFLSEGHGYEVLLRSAEKGQSNALRVLSALHRYMEKVVAAHQGIRTRAGLQCDLTSAEFVIERLRTLPRPQGSLPALQPATSVRRFRDASGGVEARNGAALDQLVTSQPRTAWLTLVANARKAVSDADFAAIGWYCGLLLSSAEDAVLPELLASLNDLAVLEMLDAAGVEGLSEGALDDIVRALGTPR